MAALFLLLAVAPEARADAGALPYVLYYGPFVCVAAIAFALALAFGGVWLARRPTRKRLKPAPRPAGNRSWAPGIVLALMLGTWVTLLILHLAFGW